MGYPLRSNIFRRNTEEHRYFRRFPLQIAVLFAPDDQEFLGAFLEMFARLDKVTGDDIVFFAVLDPPEAWLEVARNRSWWHEYQQRIVQSGYTGYTYDNVVLVNELARLFEVEWRQFPVLVVSPNLWNGEHVVAPTSAALIEPQLVALTSLVQEWGRPNTGQIIETIQETFDLDTSYSQGNGRLQSSLLHFYDVLETLDATADGFRPKPHYWGMIRRDYRIASAILDRRLSASDRIEADQGNVAQALIADAAGYLIPVASVAAKARLTRASGKPGIFLDWLEQESQALLQTSYVVGDFLEILPQILKGGPKPEDPGPLDYAPGAQGAWKAFELEINYSLVQAARASRTVVMPDYFTLYDPNLPVEKAKVRTAGRPHNINQKETRLPNVATHVFLPLGTAWHVIKTLLEDPHEQLAATIHGVLGGAIPIEFLSDWAQIAEIRNAGSHNHALGKSEYFQVMQLITNPAHFRMLHTVKQSLRC